MLVSLQEQVDESKDSDKDEEATYDAQACTAEEILNHMPTTVVAFRMHCRIGRISRFECRRHGA